MGNRTRNRDEDLARLGEPALAEDLVESFADLSHRILRECPERFGSDRAFMVLRTPPDDRSTEPPLRVVAATGRDGRALRDPDFFIDFHYLQEIGALEGAQYLPGVEEGVSRPLLSLGFALEDGARGIVLLEGEPGNRALETQGELVEEFILDELEALRRTFVFESRSDELVRTREQLEQVGELLDRRQLELDGLRHVVEEEGVLFDEVTRYHQFITRDPRTQEMIAQIERVKDTDLSVLIQGETGTGKELLARALHFGSQRQNGPFEIVSCGSIAPNLMESELFGYRKGSFSGAEEDRPGFFERADGGTLFLDEVADMPVAMQQKILRVLQERLIRPIGAAEPRPVDVRVVSSTRANLEESVRQGEFREDLLFRLDGFGITIPPLRERREDIPLLLAHFLEIAAEEEGHQCRFAESAQRELFEYSWPGNAQELRNVVLRSVLQSDRRVIARKIVQPLLQRGAEELFQEETLHKQGEELCIRIPAREGFNEIIGECERLILVHALRRHRGNKSRVTQQLGIPRQTLYNKLERHGITEDDYAEDA